MECGSVIADNLAACFQPIGTLGRCGFLWLTANRVPELLIVYLQRLDILRSCDSSLLHSYQLQDEHRRCDRSCRPL